MSTDNDNKKVQLDYLREKGKFRIDCSDEIFKSEEITKLKRFGHLFNALASGKLPPRNSEQEQFIEVAQLRKKPETANEWIWFKYIKRKELEAEKGSALNKRPTPADDTFYNRDMAKNLKNTMFKVTKENHKE